MDRIRVTRARCLVAALGIGLVMAAAPARAEIGLGGRFSFVRGDDSVPNADSQRYLGVAVRARLSPKTAIELALDYRSETDPTTTLTTKDVPIQASLLLYPVRAALSPYLLAGIGWYSQTIEEASIGSSAPASVTTRKTGYHAGIGGELKLGAHAAAHLDYRYTFIGMGDNTGTSSGAVPIPGLGGLEERLKLSHQGSMWSGGLTFYF
jgi:opacity protein-like surface antigen